MRILIKFVASLALFLMPQNAAWWGSNHPHSGGGSAVTLVQSTNGANAGAGTTLAVPYVSNNASGNASVVAICWSPATGGSAATISSVTDSQSNSYTVQSASLASIAATHYLSMNCEFAEATGITAGANTVTVTMSTSVASAGIVASLFEITPATYHSSTGATGTTATPSAGTVTPTINGSMIIAIAVIDDGFGFGSGWFTAGTGFTLATQFGGGNADGATETQAQTTAGAVVGAFVPVHPSDPGPWAASVIDFHP